MPEDPPEEQQDDEGAPERPRFSLPPRPENPFRTPPPPTPPPEQPAERPAPPAGFSPQSSRPVPAPEVQSAPSAKPDKTPPSERGVPFDQERQEPVAATRPLHASTVTAAMSPPVAPPAPPPAPPRQAPPPPTRQAPTPPPPPAPPSDSATVRLEGAAAPAAAAEAVTPVPRTVLVSLEIPSVFRLALAFYLATFAAVMMVAVVLWFMLGATGILSDVESFVGELLGYENFRFLGWKILQVTVLIGLLWVVGAAAVTAGLVFLYNQVSDIVGGVQIETKEAPRGE